MDACTELILRTLSNLQLAVPDGDLCWGESLYTGCECGGLADLLHPTDLQNNRKRTETVRVTTLISVTPTPTHKFL